MDSVGDHRGFGFRIVDACVEVACGRENPQWRIPLPKEHPPAVRLHCGGAGNMLDAHGPAPSVRANCARGISKIDHPTARIGRDAGPCARDMNVPAAGVKIADTSDTARCDVTATCAQRAVAIDTSTRAAPARAWRPPSPRDL